MSRAQRVCGLGILGLGLGISGLGLAMLGLVGILGLDLGFRLQDLGLGVQG